jgi:secreted trypsin-like serine protease
MKVHLNATDHETCVEAWEDENHINESQFCAGGVRGQDTCNGDSGGPIQTFHHGASCVYNIVGLTSYGSPMCGSTAFGVYTKVSAFLNWIEFHVWRDETIKWARAGMKLD